MISTNASSPDMTQPEVASHACVADIVQPRRWQSQQLLEGAREVQIEHHGQLYRLQVTSLGKLILTK